MQHSPASSEDQISDLRGSEDRLGKASSICCRRRSARSRLWSPQSSQGCAQNPFMAPEWCSCSSACCPRVMSPPFRYGPGLGFSYSEMAPNWMCFSHVNQSLQGGSHPIHLLHRLPAEPAKLSYFVLVCLIPHCFLKGSQS